ncbi:MAG: hybrid sensor histidine kinase/response regulator [Bacteroidetes bacterium]|nr:hybrid sensor histidine kinase/response regulator [Bacteroidota bacterium]
MENRKKNILVVDDIEQNVAVISQILRSNDYQVIAAFSGEQALKMLDKRIPDLILMDVMMPDMDGFEVCRKIKQNELIRDIPVIFLSALSEAETKVEGLEVGGVDYITKPFQESEVLARVKVHLQIRQLQQERKKHIDELIILNDEKDRLMQIVSHDLRSPLGGIRSLSEILFTGAEAKDEAIVREFSELISSTANSLLHLVNDLLDLAKVESGKLLLLPMEFDIALTIRSCVRLQKNVALNKGVVIIDEYSSPIITINADEPKLVQVINNLLSNAIKFTPKDGTITVNTTIEPSDVFGGASVLRISIRDTGIGIPPEHLPNIFEKFGKHQRMGTSGERGTGLGMPIVKRFVELHHGTITVNSTIGVGTEFIILLPVKQPESNSEEN